MVHPIKGQFYRTNPKYDAYLQAGGGHRAHQVVICEGVGAEVPAHECACLVRWLDGYKHLLWNKSLEPITDPTELALIGLMF